MDKGNTALVLAPFLDGMRQAGSELVKRGRMPKSLLEVIGQPLISEEEYRSSLNDDYIKVKRRTKD